MPVYFAGWCLLPPHPEQCTRQRPPPVLLNPIRPLREPSSFRIRPFRLRRGKPKFGKKRRERERGKERKSRKQNHRLRRNQNQQTRRRKRRTGKRQRKSWSVPASSPAHMRRWMLMESFRKFYRLISNISWNDQYCEYEKISMIENWIFSPFLVRNLHSISFWVEISFLSKNQYFISEVRFVPSNHPNSFSWWTRTISTSPATRSATSSTAPCPSTRPSLPFGSTTISSSSRRFEKDVLSYSANFETSR